MVELVGDKEAAFADERGEDGGIGDEAHAVDGCCFFAYEFGDLVLHLQVQLAGSYVAARRAEGDAVFADTLLYCICALAFGLCEAEVVVGAHVQRLGRRTSQLEAEIEIIALPVEKRDEASWHTRHRPPEDVVNAQLQASDIEVIEIAVQWRISVPLPQMFVILLSEALAEEVAHVAEDDEDEVGDVGRDEVVVWRLI